MGFVRIPGHELEGAERVYLALGYSPYDPVQAEAGVSGTLVVANGHTVDVETVWRREGFGIPTIFFYVRSRVTGEATHVEESDLLDVSSWLGTSVVAS